MPNDPRLAALANTAFRTHQETAAVDLAPEPLLKHGAVTVQGGVLTVKNEELAKLIQSKLASAAQLTAGRVAATDADVSVGVKVHF
jgi:hypothetical protein